MSIIYALIAKDKKTILVDFATNSSNVQQVTYDFLDQMKPLPKCTFTSSDRFVFHIIMEEGFIYLCVVENTYPPAIAFQFLDRVKNDFTKQHTLFERQNGIAYSFNTSFQENLKRLTKEFNTNPEGLDKVQKLKNNTEQVTTVIINNINLALQREQIVEKAVMKTTKMNESSIHIKKQANQARRDAYWRNMRVKIFIAVIIIIFIVTAIILL
ncbi:hypothetical protein ABPG74_008540 [Tetrahymena malaccensis]